MPESIAFWIGVLSGVVVLFSSYLYWRDILRGNTTPNRASFLVWTVLGVIIFASSFAGGARETLFVPGILTVSTIVTLVLSIKHGEGGWDVVDRIALCGAAVGITLWAVTGSADLALLWALASDTFAASPTIKKSWQRPQSEDRIAWTTSFAGNAISIFAATQCDVAHLAQPIWWTVLTATITLPLWLYRDRQSLQQVES